MKGLALAVTGDHDTIQQWDGYPAGRLWPNLQILRASKDTGEFVYRISKFGIPTIGKPMESGFADLSPGSLEMSNVDLARIYFDDYDAEVFRQTENHHHNG